MVFKFSYLENVLNEEVTIVEYRRTEISLPFIIHGDTKKTGTFENPTKIK